MQHITETSRVRTMSPAMADAISALQRGDGVIVADDPHRENECDFVFAASTLTEAQMALMIRHGSGIVCAVITEDHARHMGLPPMVEDNASPYQTPFTVSIEAASGVTTGVSAHDRTRTVAALCSESSEPSDLRSPGHVFPLVARSEGLSVRRGHTEATLALMQLAGLPQTGVLCEAMSDDGRMATYTDIADLTAAYNMPLVTIEEIAACFGGMS